MKAIRLSIFCIAVSLLLCLAATPQQDDSTKKADDTTQENRQEGRPEERDQLPADDR